MRTVTRTISTSVPSRMTMSKPAFGKSAEEFVRNLGAEENSSCSEGFGCRITALIPQGGEKVTVRVLVSNPSGREDVEFLVLTVHAESLELSVGEVEEEMLPELEYYAEVARAYGSACASFAFAPSSYAALSKKLLQKGFSKGVCSDAIACLRRTGFVKEDEIALRRAQIFVEKRWGSTRILAKLREEGFDTDACRPVKEYLDGVDFPEICKELIAKRFGSVPSDRHERELLCASLLRMGHSAADIRRAMAELSQNR